MNTEYRGSRKPARVSSARPALLDVEVSALLTLMNETFPVVQEMTGAQARAAIAARERPASPALPGVQSQDQTLLTEEGPLGVRLYHPVGAQRGQLPAVVFLHGGGFVFCDLDTHDGFCRRISDGTGAVVVSVDYRLAPEHRAPAGAEDGYSVLRWVVANADELGVDADRVAVAGDSAGGNLAAAVCLMARDRSGPTIAAQVLIYPVIDPACDSESYRLFGTGYVNTKAAMQWYWRQYLGGEELPRPEYLAAPLLAGNLSVLPPAIVVTAGLDPLSTEGRAYAQALRGSGVITVHRHYPGLFHGFLTIDALGAAVSARELLWHDLLPLLADKTGRDSP